MFSFYAGNARSSRLVVGAVASCFTPEGLQHWNFDPRNCRASVERSISWRRLNAADCDQCPSQVGCGWCVVEGEQLNRKLAVLCRLYMAAFLAFVFSSWSQDCVIVAWVQTHPERRPQFGSKALPQTRVGHGSLYFQTQFNAIQSNPWIYPIHIQLCSKITTGKVIRISRDVCKRQEINEAEFLDVPDDTIHGNHLREIFIFMDGSIH